MLYPQLMEYASVTPSGRLCNEILTATLCKSLGTSRLMLRSGEVRLGGYGVRAGDPLVSD